MESYRAKKLIRSKSGLRIVVTNEEFRSPFVVQEPEWIPDKEISHCTLCKIKFGFTTRRHHCRRCGLIFCSPCCNSRLELRRMCFIDPVRICIECVPKTKIENTFFEKHLRTLLNGATLILESCHPKILTNETALCKLSSDHRYILFDGMKIAPVELNRITSLKVSKDSLTGDRSVDIDYFLDGETTNLCLGTSHEEENMRKLSNLWVKAIEQAYNLIETANSKLQI